MENYTLINKQNLKFVSQACLTKRIPNNDSEKFHIELKQTLQQIWIALAYDEQLNTDLYLSCCRTGFLGLYFLYNNENELFSFLQSIDTNQEVEIPILEIKVFVQNVDTFKLSLSYGLLHLIIVKKIKSEISGKIIRNLFLTIYNNCKIQSRYTRSYFQLLFDFVTNQRHNLDTNDLNNVYNIIIHNLNKRESMDIHELILESYSTSELKSKFTSIIKNVSWTLKFKFSMLDQFLNYSQDLIEFIPHEEFIQALIFAQTKSYLSSAAGKLYTTLVKILPMPIWSKYYFPAIKEALKNPNITTSQNNLLIHLLPSTQNMYPEQLNIVMKNLLDENKIPVFTILHLMIYGIKLGKSDKDFDYMNIVDMGLKDFHPENRILAFQVLCIKNDWNCIIFRKLKQFLVLNSNTDQANRESIKKYFDKFMKNLQCLAIKSVQSDSKMMNRVIHFLNWLFRFIFNNFNPQCHQRNTLSLNLMEITLTYFSKNARLLNPTQCPENLTIFSSQVNCFRNLTSRFNDCVNIVIFCGNELKQRVFNFILNHVNPRESNLKVIMNTLDVGIGKLKDKNFKEAETGENLIEFSVLCLSKMKSINLDNVLLNLNLTMRMQWYNIKYSENVNVVVNENPLHSSISIVTTLLELYEPEKYEDFISCIEDIVGHLLEVFGTRAMLPYNSRFCHGIAKVFQDQNSIYYACTVNCMWLVLKASCKLVAKLTTLYHTSNEIMLRSLKIISSVTQNCYHKGALETAGETLSQIISNAITNNQNINVIEDYLESILKKIPETTEWNSTVRRCAEFRIILHAFAVNDKRKNKPVLHKIMTTLIDELDNCLSEMNSSPKPAVHCIVLHCLEPIIKDTAVETHIVEYLSHVTMKCLDSFKSNNWSVRNAALQTFGSIVPKLLGSNLCSNEEIVQRHAVSLQELFFKYPELYEYFFENLRLFEPSGDDSIIRAILTMCSLSYTRGDEFSNINEEITNLLSCFFIFLSVSNNPVVLELAAKAYVAACNFEHIPFVIETFIEKLCSEVYENQTLFVAHVFFVKILCDKLFIEPGFDSDENRHICTSLAKLLKKFSRTNRLYYVLFGILYPYERQLKLPICPINLELYLTYVCENSDLVHEFPGIYNRLENSLKYVLETIDLEIYMHLFIKCMFGNTPIIIKKICLDVTKNRINSEEIQELEVLLMNPLITLLLNESLYSNRYIMEVCVEIILKLDTSDINYELYTKMFNNLNRTPYPFPDYYMPVYCKVFYNNISELKVNLFVLHYAETCNKNLANDSTDWLLFQSVIYIYKSGCKSDDNFLKVFSLKLCFDMLQKGDDNIKYESAKMVAFCFNKTITYPYASVLQLITPTNLILMLNPYFALQLLVLIYIDENHEDIINDNPFEQKPILCMDTHILKNMLYPNIKETIKLMTTNQRYEFQMWFSSHVEDIISSNEIDLVRRMLDLFAD